MVFSLEMAAPICKRLIGETKWKRPFFMDLTKKKTGFYWTGNPVMNEFATSCFDQKSIPTKITDDTPFFKELINNGISKVRVVQTVITFVKNSNRVPTF